MSVLDRIAYFQGRRDEVPNQQLAREIANSDDAAGAKELAENLWSKNKNIQSDCLKVLYEIGYLNPKLVAPFADDFLGLIQSRNNRLVWGAMIALSTIASLQAEKIFAAREGIKRLVETGTVITVDNAVKTLAIVAGSSPDRRQELLPYLMMFLAGCPPRDVPRHAGSVLLALDAANSDEFVKILESRMPEMIPSRATRLRKLMREAGKKR